VVAELKDNNSWQYYKNKKCNIDNLEINTQVLKKLEREYVFPALPINNHEKHNLTFQKLFEDTEACWKIYLIKSINVRACMQKKDIVIVTPVYNDWPSFYSLAERLNYLAEKSETINTLRIFAINDGSSAEPDYTKLKTKNTTIINLTNNVGHQKAIALGLAHVANEEKCDAVVVMDTDGEDKPEDVEKLLHETLKQSGKIIFAHRLKRMEGLVFTFFYGIYKYVFKILTGKNISFGNFCVIPVDLLSKLVNVSEIWNHFPGGVIKSKIPYAVIPAERGTRFAGDSKMNFNSLVLHGLSAVASQIDIVSVRILLATLTLMVLAVAGILTVIGIRIFTDIALPGWATYVILGLLGVLIQAFLISLILVFIILNYRTQKLFIPAKNYQDYILGVKKID
jgi:polyisoprenyl-phosphate glycosyltransferase